MRQVLREHGVKPPKKHRWFSPVLLLVALACTGRGSGLDTTRRRSPRERRHMGRRPWIPFAPLIALALMCGRQGGSPYRLMVGPGEDRDASLWFVRLREGGLAGWFRWVFRSLEEHDPSCRWRRVVAWAGR